MKRSANSDGLAAAWLTSMARHQEALLRTSSGIAECEAAGVNPEDALRFARGEIDENPFITARFGRLK